MGLSIIAHFIHIAKVQNKKDMYFVPHSLVEFLDQQTARPVENLTKAWDTRAIEYTTVQGALNVCLDKYFCCPIYTYRLC